MKTKFDDLVKIEKEKLNKLERDLIKVNQAINDYEKKIDNVKEKLNSITIPKQGNFSIFKALSLQKNLYLDEIERLKSQLIMLNSRKNSILQELKEKNISYEKMKYLQLNEIKKLLKEKKLKEDRELDEIAILLRGIHAR